MSLFSWRRQDTRLHASHVDWTRPPLGGRAWAAWGSVPEMRRTSVAQRAEVIYAANPRFSEDDAWQAAIGQLVLQSRRVVPGTQDLDVYRNHGGTR